MSEAGLVEQVECDTFAAVFFGFVPEECPREENEC